jgi:hypothetical protein
VSFSVFIAQWEVPLNGALLPLPRPDPVTPDYTEFSLGYAEQVLFLGRILCSSCFGAVEEGVFSIGVSTFSETSGRIRGVLS